MFETSAMMNRNIHCTYISEKVSKIRWKPSVLSEPNHFLTASWGNRQNHIRLWEVQQHPDSESHGKHGINPIQIRDMCLDSDITEMKFVTHDAFVVSLANGDVYLLKIISNKSCEVEIQEEISWQCMHHLPSGLKCACTSFAVYDSDVATVGEDGRINLLSINEKTPTVCIKDADSCTVNCVEFVRYNELLTANIRGHFKIWDIRNHQVGDQASQTFLLQSDAIVAPTCLAFHPTQRHIIASGDELGRLAVWDLRQNTFPLNIIQQTGEAVNEVMFHPDCPEQLFSCAGGEVFHWTSRKDGLQCDAAWYLQPEGLAKYEIFQLMNQINAPIKSIDIKRNKLLAGCDTEAMYVIENVNVYSFYDAEELK